MKLRHLIDAELRTGLKVGLGLGIVLIVAMSWLHVTPAQVRLFPALVPPVAADRSPAPERAPDFGQEVASDDVRRLARWIVATGDHGGLGFVLVDKHDARLFVFEPDGRLVGAAAVLLGSAVGDDTAPGVGSKPLSQILPEERTTPAGRFLSRAGLNADHEDVIWVDYDAAVSMHRVRLLHASERRLQRLASPTAADNRISAGCINVPVGFFERVLWPRMSGGRQGVVYVLPELRPLDAVFPVAASGGG